jgi:hypothetical protein
LLLRLGLFRWKKAAKLAESLVRIVDDLTEGVRDFFSSRARLKSAEKALAATSDGPPIKAGSATAGTAGKKSSERVRNAALQENPDTCAYCRMTTDAPQVDHAIPRSRGGEATLENAQATCQLCNSSKGARDVPVTPPSGYRHPWPPPWWRE